MIERRRPILALAAPLILSACAANPLTYYTGSASRSADIVQTLAWGYTGVMVIVVVVIAALIGVGIVRSRRRAARTDSRIVGREGGGLSMIYWGSAFRCRSSSRWRYGISSRPARLPIPIDRPS